MLAKLSLSLLLSASLSQAVDIYLSPASNFIPLSSPADASAALSRHLGLERFEPLRDASNLGHEEWFVGQGSKNALLIALEESDLQGPLYFEPILMSPVLNVSSSSCTRFITSLVYLDNTTIYFAPGCDVQLSSSCQTQFRFFV